MNANQNQRPPSKGRVLMSRKKKNSKAGQAVRALSRRQFIRLSVTSVASLGAFSSPRGFLSAAQPGRKRIVIHTERPITSLGSHNRRDTEHVSMADAGLDT